MLQEEKESKKANKKGALAVTGLLLGLLVVTAACGSRNETSVQTEQEGTEATAVLEETDSYVDKQDRSDEGWLLIWNDEFDGDSLDTTKWSCQYGTGSQYGLSGWGNEELEYYTDRPENIRVEDGFLHITALKEEGGYEGKPYTSARVRTVTDEEVLFATTYGRVEARIRMPVGEGLWPAFWMLPVDESIYGGWAASGEIDIMEARGRLPRIVGGTLHYGKVWPNNTYKGGEYTFSEETDITDFHVYALEWEPDEIRWYVDDECYYSMNSWYAQGKVNATDYTKPAPFDVPFYILLNLAVGGTFDSEAKVKNALFPAVMEVDFVRVYQKEAGYRQSDTKAVTDGRDTESFAAYTGDYSEGEFILDKSFSTMNTEAIRDTDKGIAPESKDWQFAVGSFGGAATASVEELAEGSFAKIDITAGGNQTYAVQLIDHFPVVEGYTYRITFDAKASEERSFVVSPGGDGDNGWAKYGTFDIAAGTEVESYSCVFKMYAATDPTARLEFNLGLKEGSVWIGNVSVTLVEAENGVEDDMTKTPLLGGHLVYNGTFDQGEKRLAFWHAENMQAEVPDYVILADGVADYRRMVRLKAEADKAALYQRGILLQGEQTYTLKMEFEGEEDVPVAITVTNQDGGVYFQEEYHYAAAEGNQKILYTFSVPAGVEEEDAILTIALPEGKSIWLDNVRLLRNK